MGSVCSRPTEIIIQGSFEMPGVPANVAVETYSDREAMPNFVPIFESIQVIRRAACEPLSFQVGMCWLERRRVKNGIVVVRQTITKRSDNPFSVSAVSELVESTLWNMPNFMATSTLTIQPAAAAAAADDDDNTDSTAQQESCSIRWTDAIISQGILAKLLSGLCLPCLKSVWIAQTHEEWEYHYVEALRRTVKAVQKTAATGSAVVEQSNDRGESECRPG